jgi:TPR repeat protein
MEEVVRLLWEAEALETAGDIAGAIEKLRIAAKRGDAAAQMNLGNLLDDKANPRRPDQAVYWYKRALQGGKKEAAHNLAMHYKNVGKRRWHLHWLRVAARLEVEGAEEELCEITRDYPGLGREEFR